MPIFDTDTLIRLFHRKWAVPVLAELAHTGGSRIVVLRNKLGASPAAVRQTLDHLIDLKLITPNPGHGHPLRPEYILTALGLAAAESCARIQSSGRRLGAGELIGRKWALPVLWSVIEEPLRFGEIAERASPVTDRALSQSLKDLEDSRLIKRTALVTRPPAYLYGLHARAQAIASALADLAA